MEENNKFIYKWRVKAMLNNIKYFAKKGNIDNVIDIVNDYIEFVDELDKDLYWDDSKH